MIPDTITDSSGQQYQVVDGICIPFRIVWTFSLAPLKAPLLDPQFFCLFPPSNCATVEPTQGEIQ